MIFNIAVYNNSRPSQAMRTTISDVCCCTSLVCAEVTVESNPRTESPTTGGAYMIKVRHVRVVCSVFSPSSFPLWLNNTMILSYSGFSFVVTAPHLAILRKGFPARIVYIEAFQRHFKSVFKAFFLSTSRTSAPFKFAIHQLFWDAFIRHSSNVTGPSYLGLLQQGVDAWDLCSCEDFTIWNFVLPVFFSILHRQLMWKWFSFLACLLYTVHVSLAYSSVVSTMAW